MEIIQKIIEKTVDGKNLTEKEAVFIFKETLENRLNSHQIASFLTALRSKGETENENYAAAKVIRSKAVKIMVNKKSASDYCFNGNPVIFDSCGTGGSGVNKFNISTAAAFVVSSRGVIVAKHGNKAMSSSCGSADVMETLGVNVLTPVKIMEKALNKVKIGFLYAPLYHPALKTISGIRREMALRTVFNILGPLCNPASATLKN